MSGNYNGWKNYETWNVALWIGNEQDTSRESASMAQDAWDNAEASQYFTREERAASDLADSIKEWVERDMIPDLGASMAADLLGAAMFEVDWHEIAENWLEDVEKEEPADAE